MASRWIAVAPSEAGEQYASELARRGCDLMLRVPATELRIADATTLHMSGIQGLQVSAAATLPSADILEPPWLAATEQLKSAATEL
ncbi:hypothetical protein PF005_g13180 [Phytophthora fragariae]|uniref:Uncharacterized protein n=2 Tax=Phytophthora fragariae TaxID=53985 RepID=A0A6A3YRR3_9STRA|nr:hypothetical protein PF009_g14579 [Phytophthora fragariae]KAE9104664.1 hypothetical protein PF010_g13302 [Phytophthora fragariae]KAE9104906.1 hypothetical protein PF007_g13889 [Phytophthora fragariae]KAE9206005.1 hypothetical protein PF005_g13180 [Phytophthora fragariae]KAE9223874.1 hypothetical protein PF002_g14854 [Phytophthora fragariae]